MRARAGVTAYHTAFDGEAVSATFTITAGPLPRFGADGDVPVAVEI